MTDMPPAGASALAPVYVPVPPTPPTVAPIDPLAVTTDASGEPAAAQPASVADPALALVPGLVDSAAASIVPAAAVAAAGETPGQLVGDVLNAIETRKPLQSNTIRGVLILTAAALAPTVSAKFHLAPPTLQDDVMAASLVLAVWGAGQALYGRLTAKTPIG